MAKKYAPQNDAKYFTDNHDLIMVYAKKKNNWEINLLPRSEKQSRYYKYDDNDGRGLWRTDNILVKSFTKDRVFTVYNPNTGKAFNPPAGRCWRYSKDSFEKMINENRIYWGKDGKGAPQVKRYLEAVKQGITPLTVWLREEVSDNQEAKKEITNLAFEFDFETPKPEKLLQRIIHIASNENDIVLDFFMGSATTQAVSMKMNRQFIGIEQMDYISTVSVSRLQKVMNGEQGGISKDVNWQGGGSFIYTELMDLNSTFIKKIEGVDNSSSSLQILETIKKYADLNYLVELEKLTNEPIVIDENTKETLSFEELPIEKQRELLIDVMDINQLYVNYSEIDDSSYHVSEQDKAFNRSFYEAGDN